MERYSYEDFLKIIVRLRAEDGCPWDRAQTHESLKPCLIEEAYEVLEGIDRLKETGDWENLCEELGDVLLQAVMHARIAEEEGLFSMEDVVQGISEKMIRRHPHVFGGEQAKDAGDALESWEAVKAKEKPAAPGKIQDQVPRAFPALLRAQKILKKYDRQEQIAVSAAEGTERLAAAVKELGDSLESGQAVAPKEKLLLEAARMCNVLGVQGESVLAQAAENYEGTDSV